MAYPGTGMMEIAEMLCWYCLLGMHLKKFCLFSSACFVECLRRKLKTTTKKEGSENVKGRGKKIKNENQWEQAGKRDVETQEKREEGGERGVIQHWERVRSK